MFEQMSHEEKELGPQLCNCLDESDLSLIYASNKRLEDSIHDKYSFFLSLYSSLSQRIEQIDVLLSLSIYE